LAIDPESTDISQDIADYREQLALKCDKFLLHFSM